MKAYPKISVVVPAHNEELDIENTINSVLKQRYPNFEIIVVNDGSTDRTREIVERLMKKRKEIRLINFETGHSPAFSRNRGAEKATGKIILFLDADTGISDDFMKKIAEDFEDKRIAAVGHLKKNTSINLLSKLLALLARNPKGLEDKKRGHIFTEYSGFNVFVIKRDVFLKIGKYSEKIFYYEDEEMTRRFFSKGYKALWDSEILFYSEQPSDLKGFYRQYRYAGKGIATMTDRRKRLRNIAYTAAKVLFILVPFGLLLVDTRIGLAAIAAAYVMTYFFALRASKSIGYSFLMVPIMYIKNLFEMYNIIKFSVINFIKGRERR